MLAEQDRVRCRHHLGYGGVSTASTFALGIPAAIQTAFMIENAFNFILPQAEAKVMQTLDRLDAVEQQIEDDTENLAVDAVDEIKLRADEFQRLLDRYRHWQGVLANLLQVPPNDFDQRPGLGSGYGGGDMLTAKVRHG